MAKAKKSAGAARTSVSVPSDLKRRMDKVADSVNWSAVACRAFEAKLAELAAKKASKDMSDVVARLRESKRSNEGDAYKQGFAAGQEWAKDTAEADELQRLERYRQSLNEYDWETVLDSTVGSRAYSTAEIIASAIIADDGRDAASDFWESAVGDDHEALTASDSYVKGFAEGALDIWDEVKAEL